MLAGNSPIGCGGSLAQVAAFARHACAHLGAARKRRHSCMETGIQTAGTAICRVDDASLIRWSLPPAAPAFC